jgi:hypothetical protein
VVNLYDRDNDLVALFCTFLCNYWNPDYKDDTLPYRTIALLQNHGGGKTILLLYALSLMKKRFTKEEFFDLVKTSDERPTFIDDNQIKGVEFLCLFYSPTM